mgnify:CR=1 FL=1
MRKLTTISILIVIPLLVLASSLGTTMNSYEQATDFVNPTYAYSNDSYRATVKLEDYDVGGYWHTNSFSIPTGATIDGIVVRVDNWFTHNDASFASISIAANDNGNYTAFTKNFPTLYTSEYQQSFGGAADKWGNNGWSAAEINSGFLVDLKAMTEDPRNAPTWYVDYIYVWVYYTEAGQLKVNKVEAWKSLNIINTEGVNKINKVINE